MTDEQQIGREVERMMERSPDSGESGSGAGAR